MPRSSQAASWSGRTASPTSGTNAISPRPAVARIDAAVAITTPISTTPKTAATSRRWPQTNVKASRAPLAHADVLDRDHHLGHQVEEVQDRQPHDQHARRGRRGDGPPEQDGRIVGQRVAAEDERQVDRRGQRVHDQQADADAEVAPPQPRAAGEERVDADDVGAAEGLEPQRRLLDRTGRPFGLREQRDHARP